MRILGVDPVLQRKKLFPIDLNTVEGWRVGSNHWPTGGGLVPAPEELCENLSALAIHTNPDPFRAQAECAPLRGSQGLGQDFDRFQPRERLKRSTNLLLRNPFPIGQPSTIAPMRLEF